MNVKKFLKEKAKQDREALLTESDKVFFENLKSEVEENSMERKNRRSRFWISGLVGAATTVLVLVSVLVFYLHSNRGIEYLEGNFEHLDSNIEEVENTLHDFSVTIDLSVYSCDVTKVRDQISGDTLYFILSIRSANTLKSMEMVIVTNEYYHYNTLIDTNDFISAENSSYSFIYQIDKSIDEEFGLTTLTAKAELHKNKEFIYVLNYTELLFGPDGTFIETIQDIVK